MPEGADALLFTRGELSATAPKEFSDKVGTHHLAAACDRQSPTLPLMTRGRGCAIPGTAELGRDLGVGV
jgi:hypothetical protein